MLHTATLLLRLFVVLAELWNDTRERHAKPLRTTLPQPGASASAHPDNENAATLPGAAASRPNQPTADRDRPGRKTSRKIARSASAGHPTLFKEKTNAC
jgi:hypothetical protein